MKTIVLHRLGPAVSHVGVGSMKFDTESFVEAAQILDACHAEGRNPIDTAEVYADGRSERAIGEYLRCRDSRDEWSILTKVCASAELVRPDYMRQAVPRSLERLRSQHVELLGLHRQTTTRRRAGLHFPGS